MTRLTPSEAAVARLLLEGYTPKEAAATLGVELAAVRLRIKRGAARLPGAHSPIVRMVLWAREERLTQV